MTVAISTPVVVDPQDEIDEATRAMSKRKDNRDDEAIDTSHETTTTRVGRDRSVGAMPPTQNKALDPKEADRVRATMRIILAKYGDNQTAAARATGIRQQQFSTILAGANIGMVTAKRIAKHEGIPLEALLSGTPWPLEEMLRSNKARFSASTAAWLRSVAQDMQRPETKTSTEWERLAEEAEQALAPLRQSFLPRGRGK